MHAHIEWTLAGCDGTIVTTRLAAKQPGEYDWQFKNRVGESQIDFFAEHVDIAVRDGRISIHGLTEEGYAHGEVEWCEDPTCDLLSAPEYRDLAAEAAGY